MQKQSEKQADFTYNEWIKWTFEKYSNGSQVLNKRQLKLAIISLTGEKIKLGPKEEYTLDDLRNMVADFTMKTFFSKINQIYEEIDKQQNGYIELKDLYANAQLFCPSITPLLEEAFKIVDKDGDGMISYKEFISAVEKGFKNI